MRQATDLRREGRHFSLSFTEGRDITTRAVVLAMGASYQRLGVPAIDAFVGAGVFYGGGVTEAPALAGQHVFVAGAGNSAGQAAVHLSKYADRVTLVVRGAHLASRMSDYLVRDIEAAENIEVRLRTEIVGGSGRHHLEQVVLRDAAANTEEVVSTAALFILIGTQPRTDWLPAEIARDPSGFILTGPELPPDAWDEAKQKRAPLLLETSLPGIFAAGDVRHGSVKRVASAVGEGGIAIQQIHTYLALADHAVID
jgi:thioredoxin reductase (NADPH)